MGKSTVKGIVGGVLAGAIVGAALALLFATQPDRKTRKEIVKRADEVKARADNFVASVKERDEAFCRAVKEGADNYRKETIAKIGS